MSIGCTSCGAAAAQAVSLQTRIAATILKANVDSEKSTVLALLGAPQQGTPSPANLGPGVGGKLDVSA